MRAELVVTASVLLQMLLVAPHAEANESGVCLGGPQSTSCFPVPYGHTCHERGDHVHCPGYEGSAFTCFRAGHTGEYWCLHSPPDPPPLP